MSSSLNFDILANIYDRFYNNHTTLKTGATNGLQDCYFIIDYYIEYFHFYFLTTEYTENTEEEKGNKEDAEERKF
jgi:hypothetical protein